MRQIRGWFVRLFGLFHRARREHEFAEELESHLAFHIEDNLRAGLSPEEARRRALIKLGGVTLTQELYREQGGLPMLEVLLQDLRFGLRMLRKNPGFSLLAILTLALGIGANTTIFSVVNAVVFLRLPFSEADRLVLIGETDARGRLGGVAPANFLDWREQSHAFEQVAAKLDWSGYDLAGGGDPEQVIGVPVSASIFPLLKVQPVLGRAFLPEEDRPGGPPVVLLSYRLWQRRFNSDPKAVGETLALNGNPHIIIGVMPAGFYLNRDTESMAETDQLWVPLAQQLGVARMAWRQTRNLRVWGRLKPGVSLAQAQAEMEIIQRQLQQTYPADGGERGVKVLPLSEWRAEQMRRTYGLLSILLEPEWEARFEPNSYGFRPGRSAHDAIKAIYDGIKQKPKWVLDADLSKCFDRIDQAALLAKLNTNPKLRRIIKGWLEAGVMEGEELFPTTAGTPQGGVISPLLANIALHGLETIISERFPPRRGFRSPKVVRYADDFVILHEDREVIEQCLEIVKQWFGEVGLELNESKTRITQTLETTEGEAGFDFLGFRIKQYPAGKYASDRNGHGQAVGCITRIEPSPKAIKRHTEKLRETVKRHRAGKVSDLIEALNPQIAGWSNYYKYVSSHAAFHKLGTVLFAMLYAWARASSS
ncbi:MAG: reverse transcriptase domain-containing protein [Blastocatellia bacterium]